MAAATITPALPQEQEPWHDLCDQQVTINEVSSFGFRGVADLTFACIQAGIPIFIASSDETATRLLPLDVQHVALVLEPGLDFNLGRMADVRVHPIARDARCARFAADWKRLGVQCPFPSMFDVEEARLLAAGLQGAPIADAGIPFALTMSGEGRIFVTGEARIFSKSVTLDHFTGSVNLEGLIVEGDVTIQNSQLDSLSLDNADIGGQLIIKNSSIDNLLTLPENSFAHGGVSVLGLTGAADCQNRDGLQEGFEVSGPLLLSRCLAD